MITVIAGKQGAGKTLYAVHLLRLEMKKGKKCFSNQYVEGAFKLQKNWYDFRYDKESTLLIDEAQLEYNCRDYSTKDRQEMYKKILEYLTMCRHYDIDIIFITQSLDRLDVQIRELATEIIRFRKTYRILYFNFKNMSFEFFPIFQSGRYFEDNIELTHFLNSSTDYDNFGQKFLKFVDQKAKKMYFTHIKDKKYIDKDLSKEEIYKITTFENDVVLE